ncbi:hypothetical protein JZ751_018827, partial [Albula glossodonta]
MFISLVFSAPLLLNTIIIVHNPSGVHAGQSQQFNCLISELALESCSLSQKFGSRDDLGVQDLCHDDRAEDPAAETESSTSQQKSRVKMTCFAFSPSVVGIGGDCLAKIMLWNTHEQCVTSVSGCFLRQLGTEVMLKDKAAVLWRGAQLCAPSTAEELSSGAPGTAEELSSGAPGTAEELSSGAPGTAEELSSGAPGTAEELSSVLRVLQRSSALCSGYCRELSS